MPGVQKTIFIRNGARYAQLAPGQRQKAGRKIGRHTRPSFLHDGSLRFRQPVELVFFVLAAVDSAFPRMIRGPAAVFPDPPEDILA